ncbi:Piso0_004571 [Millerozyma farinosa CBS 7064]|uniref:Alternative oxidase n=1 Tax=Pichia sorbitophila (strain ATCC MYA-4447 / BCRC 22081 / CBS 7064 / NBRC 10061 / NRRL Y-12695) TaxID=559304 RepID=G8Y960_PICSO|nr:Piso0_004571 [Millerozyma farinosa CBS 7064]CCE85005.1 Piso0_004571 [Millerozyma farinosa CBS 7064]
MLARRSIINAGGVPLSYVFVRHAATKARSLAEATTKPALGVGTRIVERNEIGLQNDHEFITEPAFKHPNYGLEKCKAITYDHREPVTFGDKVTYNMILAIRRTFDFVTGYKKPQTPEEKEHAFKGTRYEMTESKWMTRVIFLESVAGVPGMVAAFIRHLHSLRLLRRDKAWIETLLDEAYNERMHLLTFMKLGKPSWFTKLIIYAGQGVFCNMFFFSYLLNPRYCHRFVGYLEEEAVSTYTHLLDELEAGKLPKFDHIELPEISWHYWGDLNEKSSFYDLVSLVRADEAKHREVNHTLANLKQRNDRNPFAMSIPEEKKTQPSNTLSTHKPKGWDRKDLIL